MHTGVEGKLLVTPMGFERIANALADYFSFMQYRQYNLFIQSYGKHADLDEALEILAQEKDLPGPDFLKVYADHPLFSDTVVVYPGVYKRIPNISEGLIQVLPLLVPQVREVADQLNKLGICTPESLILVCRKTLILNSVEKAVKEFLKELLERQFN